MKFPWSQCTTCLVPSGSRSLAICWGRGIIELIIKKSGDERSDGKGRKSEALFSLFPSHRSPLALCPHSQHPPLAFLAFLQLSRFWQVLAQCSTQSLGKGCGGGICTTRLSCCFRLSPSVCDLTVKVDWKTVGNFC